LPRALSVETWIAVSPRLPCLGLDALRCATFFSRSRRQDPATSSEIRPARRFDTFMNMTFGKTEEIGNETAEKLELGIPGFNFIDLHRAERLAELHRSFLADLAARNADLARRWAQHGDGSVRLHGPEESELLIELAREVAKFLARMFHIEAETARRREFLVNRQLVYKVRDAFVKKNVKRVQLADGESAESVRARSSVLLAKLPGIDGIDADDEERFAARVWNLLQREPSEIAIAGEPETVARALDLLALDLKLRRERNDPALAHWRSLHEFKDVDFEKGLVEHVRPMPDLPEAIEGPREQRRLRDGFKLTDRRGSLGEILTEVDHCILCHAREKDSCAKGLFDKKTKEVVKNPLGIPLEGCPLDERISEMHQLYAEGDPIAALAMVMLDNPMCPGTGHRICNDCMKACIFQKQEPVNIPQIETRVLTDALNMSYGPEIYLLLTRWNPLRRERPYPLPNNGINVLVVGLGPAGYTLAHYLCQEGFGVVGVDGLKVEPLPSDWTGKSRANRRSRDDARTNDAAAKIESEVPTIPIASYGAVKRELDERVLLGFGGVSEYGITVRWDKNFLTLPYLSLLRRENFEMYGGVRFGGTLDLDEAWKLGFDHVAIATGAGKPTVVDMKNNLSRGIRKASDFLMALQLTGAFKRDSFANLQLRMPVVVIGGGLTGIDTATEAMAYYPLQVEKIAGRYDVLCEQFAEASVRRFFSDEEQSVLDEMLAHGRAVAAERERASLALARGASDGSEKPDFVSLVKSWGGVRLVYRKTLEDSPAYRLNHEEVIKALEEGITFVECMAPTEALLDKLGAVRGVVFERQKKIEDGRWRGSGEMVEMPARSVLVAAGTSPNIMYEKERPGTFALDKWKSFFRVHRKTEQGLEVVEKGRDAQGYAFFTSYDDGSHTVTVYGDNHPAYAGNVVKAMASARDGFDEVVATFRARIEKLDASEAARAARKQSWRKLAQRLDYELEAVVHEVNRLTPTITEVIVHAPAAARRFEPGQFYRLQNYEVNAPSIDGTKLAMEGIALTGAWTDPARGLLSMIVLEMGVSSRLCTLLQPGERVVVMGPTGAPTEIPSGERVILAGGGLGNAVLFSIGRALREKHNEVIYFAAFKRGEDLFKRDEIESAADVVIWSTDGGREIALNPKRPYDRHFRGNVVQAMLAYAKGDLDDTKVDLDACSRLVCIGSDRMMNAMRESRKSVLKPYLDPKHIAIGSINSPMQCMMKEICAQCLCKHVDPETGAEITPVFSCFNQDQLLDTVDFDNLNQRLRQNSVQEKLSNLWLDHLVHAGKLPMWATL
jgi:NADPH-dependent glutamate synthase beta subunit-like oxidoreductase/NAD(P)H-flavin reductase